MRKGVSGVRRVAAILSVSLVTILVTGTGAGAAVAPKLVNFSSVGSGQVLSLDLQLPSALDAVLSPAGLSSHIKQVVSFSRSIGQVDRKVGNAGSGLGQVMEGTLNPVLETVVGRALPKVFASLGEALKTDSIIDTSVADMVNLGIMKVSAQSALQKAADGLNAVVSNSKSSVASLEVKLAASLTSQLKSILQPVLNITDGANGGTGLIDQINVGLKPVVDTVNDTLGTNINITLPDVADLLDRPLLSIGVIETESATGLEGLARTAMGVTRLANVRVLGTTDDNALLSIKSLESVADVSLGGAKPVANAVNRIVGLKILGNSIDLTSGSLNVLGKEFALPVEGVLQPLQKLLADTLGLEVSVLGTKKQATATHAFAEANTLKIGLKPLNGALGLALELAGPTSMAEIQGSTVAPVSFNAPLPTTGVPTTAYFLAGPALLGLAVLVRKYALAH